MSEETRQLERVMLGVRTADGVALAGLPGAGGVGGAEPDPGGGSPLGARVAALIADGLLDGGAAVSGRAVLTLRGRLLADYVTRELMGY